jgi:hypothetical protein
MMGCSQKRPLLPWRKAIVLLLGLTLCALGTHFHDVSRGDASSNGDSNAELHSPLMVSGQQVPFPSSDPPQAYFPLVVRSEPPLTFAVMADTHSGIDRELFPRIRQEVDRYHRNAVARIRAIHPPFYVVVGDLVHVGSDLSAWHSFFDIEGALMAESTLYPALGNHEANHRNYFDFFHLPNNERWYSWDYKDAHFIVLEVDGYASVAPGSQQYRWLVNDLSSTTKTWKFVFFHIPIYGCGPSWGSPDLEARAALHPLFRAQGVDIVFSAHDHNYQRHVVDGLTYIVTGGGGGMTWGLGDDCDHWPEYWEETRHVLEVRVTRNTVTSTAIRPDGSRFDQFSLMAD